MTAKPDDTFFDQIVRPYFTAISTWWSTVEIGVTAGELHGAVVAQLDDASFGPLLNPGHMTGHDEWVHGFVLEGSSQSVESGMMFQCDIIPSPVRDGWAINCEDTLAIADEALRAEIQKRHPAVWTRIQEHRSLMQSLGIELHADVLPLSTLPGVLPPFWGEPELVCAV